MSNDSYTCCACLKTFKFGQFPEHDKKMMEAKKSFPDLPFIHLQYVCEPCGIRIRDEMDEDDKRSKAHLN